MLKSDLLKHATHCNFVQYAQMKAFHLIGLELITFRLLSATTTTSVPLNYRKGI